MTETTIQPVLTLAEQALRAAARSLLVTVVNTQEELQQAMPKWLEFLDRGTVGHNVHNDPRMISFVLDEQPDLVPRILLVWQLDALICVAPFYEQPARFSFEFSVWRPLSLRARALRLFGESVVMAADADPEPLVAAVGEFLAHESSSIDYLHIYGLNQSDRFWQSAFQDDALSTQSRWIRVTMRAEKIHQVRMGDNFESYVANLNSGTRRTLRRTRHRMFDDGKASIDKITQPGDVPRLLRFIDEVYAESWQAKTFGENGRCDVASQARLKQVAAEGWLRSYVLLRDGEPIAYQNGYQYQRVYYGRGTAFSQKWSSTGPGSILNFCMLEDFHDSADVDVWDFGFGDLPYKRSFGNEEHDAAIVYFVPRNRWRYILKLQTALNSTYDGVRSALVRLGVDRFVRKLVKRQK